jgi:hypothetical protein
VRLDHLLSKESTARAFEVFILELGKLLRRPLATRTAGDPDPAPPPGARGTTGSRRIRTSLFRFEGARDRAGLRAGGEQSVHPGQRGTGAHVSAVTVARDLCPPDIGGARSHPLVENCRASTSIKNEETPKLQRANGGCLGARCR